MARIPYKNVAILCGLIGNNPTVRYMPSGDAVMSIRLATKDSWKDAQDNWQTHTEWHTVVFYRKVAERAKDYKKGDCIYVEGRKFTRIWKDAQQNEKTSIEVIGEDHHRIATVREKDEPVPQDEPRIESRDEPPPHTSLDGPDAMAKMA